MVRFSREDCLRVAWGYLMRSRRCRQIGRNPRRAAGLLNSAHYWRRLWQQHGGVSGE